MGLSDTDIKDLITGTLKKLGKGSFNCVANKLQNYEVMGRILKQEKVQEGDGYGVQRTIMVKSSGAAKHTTLYATDNVAVNDTLATISTGWSHTTTNMAWERRELLYNRGESRIVDLMKVRRADMMLGLADLMEQDFWTWDGTDTLAPFGVPYWIPKPTAGQNDFVTNVTATTNPGGLSPTTYEGWRSYASDYATVSKDDLITKMRTAYRKIRFKSPVDIPDFRRGNGDQYRIYCNETTINALELLGESQNDNLGRDLATMDDTMTFRRNPIVWVPKLDTDTTYPIYFINYAYFYPYFLTGDYLRESEPGVAPHQHNVFVVHCDLTWQIICTDRRSQACLAIV
jgi:hypothetical protein